jgi:hypothetical protein
MMQLNDAVRAILKKPLIARMSVIDSRGYPHTIPVWYMLDGDQVVIVGVRATRKTDYIKANPKGSIQIGGDSSSAEGYLLKGTFALEEGTSDHWLTHITHLYEPKELAEEHLAEWLKVENIVWRFTIERVAKI